MVDVIIFGIIGNRQDIERILDDDVNICGYMDMGAYFEDGAIKTYESKPFYTLNDLDKIQYDYIIVCCNSERNYLICEKILLDRMVPMDKIIPTWFLTFKESVFQSTYDDYIEQNKPIEVAIFGMSFSRNGIMADLIGKECFKFSLNGMDLHGIELYITNLMNNSVHFSHTKTIILETPYFIFNHDNCSSNQIQRRMCIYDEFDDWGNYRYMKFADLKIEQYRNLKRLVARKYEKIKCSESNNYMFTDIINESQEDYLARGVWNKIHMETIKENEKRFENILSILNTIGAKIFCVIFPFTLEFTKKK